ncbi:MAG: integrase family protein [Phenylobacterium sp.]|nr:integrase family protein [Phenylobacterium sp.]
MHRVLTDKAILAAKPKPGPARNEIPDAALPGLYLIVQPSGAKGWAFRYRHQTKPRKLALGPLAPPGSDPPEPALDVPLTLVGARKLAREQALAVAGGHDPAAEKQAAKAAARAPQVQPDRDLVRVVAADFLRRYVKPRAKPSYYRSVDYILTKDVLPAWGERRIQDLRRRDVLDLLDAVVERGAATQANRVLATARKLLNWAVQRDVLASSPAAGVRAPTPETSRARVLSDDELRWAWLAAGDLGFPFGDFVRLAILTGQRRGEIAGMRRSELSDDLWTLPPERTKNGREHAVPLAPAAQAIINGLPRIAVAKTDPATPRHKGLRDLALSTTGKTPPSGFDRAKERLDARMLQIAKKEAADGGEDPDHVEIPAWVFHDLRRSCASGMARLGVALPVVERCLNHVSGSFSGIVGVYQRHGYTDEKRDALTRWAAHVVGLTQASPGNVKPFPNPTRNVYSREM